MADGLSFGPLAGSTAHLCVDMQTMFAERTDWHVPWLERILPTVLRITRSHGRRTVFTRFVPPERPEEMPGSWRRYYERWRHMTGDRLSSTMIELVPALAELVPPAVVLDKRHYSPFTEPDLGQVLNRWEVDTLVVTGGETDVCVLATVMSAVDLGYRVVLVRDALCSVSDETHDSLLKLYTERFGQQIEVAEADAVLANWD